jgi:hypothetical protein
MSGFFLGVDLVKGLKKKKKPFYTCGIATLFFIFT